VHKFVTKIIEKIFFGSFITCILKGYIRLTLRSMTIIKSVSESFPHPVDSGHNNCASLHGRFTKKGETYAGGGAW
jgi:hypothetical protein